MNGRQRNWVRGSGAVLCTAALAACGGGGSGTMGSQTPPALDAVPASASTSVQALVSWASQLPPSDLTQPLSTASFTPPVDDTAQPMPVAL